METNSILTSSTSLSSKSDEAPEEIFWEILDGVDLDIFNGLDAELSLFKEPQHLHNIINFISTSIDDYPPEFFLQSPNILNSLLDIVLQVPPDSSIKIVQIVRFLINSLNERCLDSQGAAKSRENLLIPIKKHINLILRTLTNFFERFHDNFSSSFFLRNQELLNEIYYLLFDLTHFISQTQNVCEIFLNELMNMIARVVKDLRLSYATARRDSGWIPGGNE